jgi:hypothetical protein
MKTKLKSIAWASLIVFALPIFAYAEDLNGSDDPSPCCLFAKQHPLVEAKLGYFFFTDAKMRDVYDAGGIDAQLSGSYPVYKFLHVYGSVEYLEKSGRSKGGHQKTSFWNIPLSLGVRAVVPFRSYAAYYLTLGPRYCFAHVHNHSSYVPKHMHENTFAGFANTGFLFTVGSHFTFDVMGEYSYAKTHFHSSKAETTGHTVQIGGLTFSGGLGYSF